MTTIEPAAAPTPAIELTPEEKKKRRNAKLSMWAGGFVTFALGVRLLFLFVPTAPTLAACNDDGVEATLKAISSSSAQVQLKSVDAIRSVSHTDTSNVCGAHIVAADGSQAQITYRIDLANKQNIVHITSAQ